MILVDSSAWIEFQRGTESPAHLRLRSAVTVGEPIAVTGTIVMEVLAGARDDRELSALRRLLARARFLALREPDDEESAAALYRSCRRQGTTIRRLPDCLIAAVAIRNATPVLRQDGDFDALARHTPLQVVEV